MASTETVKAELGGVGDARAEVVREGISRRKADRVVQRLNVLVWTMENAMEGDPGVTACARELRRISKQLA